MPAKQLISYFLWTVFTIVATYYVSVGIMNFSTYRSHDLSQMIHEDVHELAQRPDFKNYFQSIKQVDPVATDKISSVWVNFVKPQIQAQSSGRYKLEILFISQNDEGLKAVVQYHFVDLTNGDSVEEFARYYDLKSVL